MADRVLASYPTNPNWQQQQYQNWGNLLGMATQAYRRRQDDRKAKDLAAINQFLDLASKQPDVAAGPYGREILSKYSKDYPEIVPLVGALAEPGKRMQEMEGAGKKWLSTADQLWNEIEQKKQAAAGQLDYLPNPLFPGGSVPNLAKLTAQQDMEKVDPNQVFLAAAQKLKPSERYAAQNWAKARKGEFPDIGMGWLADPSKMPSDVQALLGAMGTSDPSKVQGDIRALLNLEPRKGVQLEVTHRTNEAIRESREREAEQRKTQEGASGFRIKEENIRHGHNISEDAAHHAQMMSEIAARQADDGEADASDPLAKKVLKWQNASVKDYDARLKSALQGTTAGEEGNKAATKKAFLNQNGVRPRALNPAQGKQIERETESLAKAGILSPDEADSFALRAASRFNAMTSREPQKDAQALLNQALMEEAITQSLRRQGVSEDELAEAHGKTRSRFFDLRKKGLSRNEALKGTLTVPYEETKAASQAGRALAGQRWGKKGGEGQPAESPAMATARKELGSRIRASMKGKPEAEIEAKIEEALALWVADQGQ